MSNDARREQLDPLASPDATVLRDFAALASELTGSMALAQAEFEEQCWVVEATAPEQQLPRMYADDRDEVEFPARYRAPGWEVILSRALDGEPYAMLIGASAATLGLGQERIHLEPGARHGLPTLAAPPREVTLLLADVALSLPLVMP